jgi:hypothetical protein
MFNIEHPTSNFDMNTPPKIAPLVLMPMEYPRRAWVHAPWAAGTMPRKSQRLRMAGWPTKL